MSSGVCKQHKRIQPAHSHSLISTVVIRLLESIISRLAIGEISFFKLVSVDEETEFSLTLYRKPQSQVLSHRGALFSMK